MKRVIGLMLTLILCCSFLTGCVGEIAEVKIESDGSGVVNMQFGFTDEALETMVALGTDPSEIDHYKPFVYNGVTYYGENISQSFNSVSEFNDIMNGNAGIDTQELVNNTGAFNLTKDETGAFTFVLDVSNEDENIGVDVSEYTEEEIETLTENMQILFTITFPANITQIQGDSYGVSIKGNTLKLDFIKMSENESIQYVFISDIPNNIKFTDVADNHWANSAIYSLANGGLVAGIGNNQFAPNNTLTRAQFYQILARALGLEVGEENGYWAYKAIQSCNGYGVIVKPLDNISEVEFNVPILREEAVAAITLATEYIDINMTDIYNPISSLDIPDYDNIDSDYQEYILTAFEYGITSGTDSNKTFNPKGQLTRAQGCQLFYNLNWCSIPR